MRFSCARCQGWGSCRTTSGRCRGRRCSGWRISWRCFRGPLQQYGRRAQTRSDHLQPVLKCLDWKPVPTRGETLKELEQFLLDRAMEHDRPSLLFQQAAEHLISSKVVRPGVVVLMKMVGSARNAAGALTSEKVDHLLTGPMRADLGRLLVFDEELGMTRLAWLTTPAVEATPAAVKGSIDKLQYLRGLDAHRLDLSMLPTERRRFLATLGRRSTVQGLQRRGERRFPILLALVAQSAADQLDEVVALFDQAVSARESHAKAKTDAALAERAKKGEARQLLMDVILPVLIDPGVADEQVGGLLRERIGMDKLREVASVSWKPLPRDHGRLAALEASHTYLRRFTPQVLEAVDFQGGPGIADLMEAVEILKELNRVGGRKVPAGVPMSFVPARYADYLVKARKAGDDTAFRHYWEICTILALRDGLRSGDVFVPGSRRYADPGTYLFTPEQWEGRRAEFCHLVRKPAGAAEAIEQVKDELHQALEDLEETLADSTSAQSGWTRPGNSSFPPLPAEDVPAEAQALRDELSSMLPFVPIASLLIELDARTSFLACFTHAGGRKSTQSVELKRNILAVLIAGATNLGLTRMSETCGVSYDTLAWTQEWYVREETLRKANTVLVNHHYALELAGKFGGGTMSSSDGQRFPVRGKSLTGRDMVIHGGRVLSTYTHVSDQWSTYGTKQIVPTAREGHYTLDELLGNATDLPITTPPTPTARPWSISGCSAWSARLSLPPRIGDLGKITMLRVETPGVTNARYPHTGPLLADRWNEDLIIECYPDLLRMAGSLKFGEATASLIVGKWSTASRQNTLAAALKEWGRMRRTIHAARYLSDPVYRRKISRQLNKGESLHALRRDLHHAQQGTIVRPHLQDQTEQAWCLTLLTNAVITWTTEYHGKAIGELRAQGRDVGDELLSFIAPGHRGNINFLGFITVDIDVELAKLIEGWRPLRPTRVHDAGLPFLLNP
ncbi:Tn3 family transposase [Nonomuraea jabiensis]|uniref:Tn3 family transposase n=1 Tax=Nonomuraea jabiensis TaxID=882448 RepID=UPI0036CA998D